MVHDAILSIYIEVTCDVAPGSYIYTYILLGCIATDYLFGNKRKVIAFCYVLDPLVVTGLLLYYLPACIMYVPLITLFCASAECAIISAVIATQKFIFMKTNRLCLMMFCLHSRFYKILSWLKYCHKC